MASWPSTRDPKGPMKRSIGILNKQFNLKMQMAYLSQAKDLLMVLVTK